MNESHFNLAMDASDGVFAYLLRGVMTSPFEADAPCPDVQAEALSYLQTFYPHVLVKDEANENTSSNPLQWS